MIITPDGWADKDDVIPRSASNGEPGAYSVAVMTETDRKKGNFSPQFNARVDDAKRRLKSGESRISVRESHGSIILRQAVAELSVAK